MRPTELAEFSFRQAISSSTIVPKGTGNDAYYITGILSDLADGLISMSRGLRATYIKLEEIERQIKARAPA